MLKDDKILMLLEMKQIFKKNLLRPLNQLHLQPR